MSTPRTRESERAIRERIWKRMERERIARFPRPVFGRIPNFDGAGDAAQRLADLPVFITPTRIIKTRTRRRRPRGLLWEHITEAMLEQMPVLRTLHARAAYKRRRPAESPRARKISG